MLASVSGSFELARGLAWPEIDEPYETLEENAIHKAKAVVMFTGLAALADDTGLEVAALGGAPGVRTARFAGPGATYDDNVAKLLETLDGEVNREARFRTVVALVRPDGGQLVAEGVLEGRIATNRRGTNGFGYDPIFEVAGHEGRTLAELPEVEKNQISHRARALRRLVDLLSH